MKSSKKPCGSESSGECARSSRSRNVGPVDNKVLFERLWKGTFRAIVEASLQSRDKDIAVMSAARRNTLKSVISVKESHQIAEANQEKNAKMREALGISPFFVEGSSLDPERKAKEAAAEEAKKKYTLIPDSSSDSAPEKTQEKEKNKKRKKKKSRSSREKSVSKKKKSSRKHRKERGC